MVGMPNMPGRNDSNNVQGDGPHRSAPLNPPRVPFWVKLLNIRFISILFDYVFFRGWHVTWRAVLVGLILMLGSYVWQCGQGCRDAQAQDQHTWEVQCAEFCTDNDLLCVGSDWTRNRCSCADSQTREIFRYDCIRRGELLFCEGDAPAD